MLHVSVFRVVQETREIQDQWDQLVIMGSRDHRECKEDQGHKDGL